MPFSARNARYLRISSHTVLPLYIYLDDKHIGWMSDYVLQRVLADLRLDIGPKLRAESSISNPGGHINAKNFKGSVEVHRGDTYQFAYFFRKNEPHAVLLKNRRFIPAPTPAVTPSKGSPLPPPNRKKRKRGEALGDGASSSRGSEKAPHLSKNGPATSDNEETSEHPYEEINRSTQGNGRRRSNRARNNVASEEYVILEGSDTEMSDYDLQDTESVVVDPLTKRTSRARSQRAVEQGVNTADSQHSDVFQGADQPGFPQIFNIDTEGEEEKPKMAMKVSYQGFTIYNKCICLVIEPWPPLREASRLPPLLQDEMRATSVVSTTQHGVPALTQERTPLFLPDIDARRSLTPAPMPSRILPPAPLFEEAETETAIEESGDNIMSFSQVLKSLGDERAGSVDEDENEGDVFLGDADERRGS